jgi:hypothetical protein
MPVGVGARGGGEGEEEREREGRHDTILDYTRRTLHHITPYHYYIEPSTAEIF